MADGAHRLTPPAVHAPPPSAVLLPTAWRATAFPALQATGQNLARNRPPVGSIRQLLFMMLTEPHHICPKCAHEPLLMLTEPLMLASIPGNEVRKGEVGSHAWEVDQKLLAAWEAGLRLLAVGAVGRLPAHGCHCQGCCIAVAAACGAQNAACTWPPAHEQPPPPLLCRSRT
jgi:hypothetical protein